MGNTPKVVLDKTVSSVLWRKSKQLRETLKIPFRSGHVGDDEIDKGRSNRCTWGFKDTKYKKYNLRIISNNPCRNIKISVLSESRIRYWSTSNNRHRLASIKWQIRQRRAEVKCCCGNFGNRLIEHFNPR